MVKPIKVIKIDIFMRKTSNKLFLFYPCEESICWTCIPYCKYSVFCHNSKQLKGLSIATKYARKKIWKNGLPCSLCQPHSMFFFGLIYLSYLTLLRIACEQFGGSQHPGYYILNVFLAILNRLKLDHCARRTLTTLDGSLGQK